MPELHVFEIDDCDWYVARDNDHLLALYFAQTGIALSDGDHDVRMLPDDNPLTLYTTDDRGGPTATMTCAAWAAKNGEGFLASTEY